MQIHDLKPQTRRKRAKLIGRGGKRGKTSGRGGKGQTARAGAKLRSPLREIIKHLPKRRGFGKNRASSVIGDRLRSAVINLGDLEKVFSTGAEITPNSLHQNHLIKSYQVSGPVKILGGGQLSKKIIVSGCLVSRSAREKIEKAGGTVETRK